jgi:WhiB family redox-sensing transcriptional regulator
MSIQRSSAASRCCASPSSSSAASSPRMVEGSIPLARARENSRAHYPAREPAERGPNTRARGHRRAAASATTDAGLFLPVTACHWLERPPGFLGMSASSRPALRSASSLSSAQRLASSLPRRSGHDRGRPSRRGPPTSIPRTPGQPPAHGGPVGELARRNAVPSGPVLLDELEWLVTQPSRDIDPHWLLRFPRWMDDASCVEQHEGADWFPENRPGRDARSEALAAKAVCARCPVRKPCLDYALQDASLMGVWGGTSERERRHMRVRRRREAAA